MEIEQMDIKTTFLHGEIEEEIYKEQPKQYMVKGKEKLMYKLNRSLYGLR